MLRCITNDIPLPSIASDPRFQKWRHLLSDNEYNDIAGQIRSHAHGRDSVAAGLLPGGRRSGQLHTLLYQVCGQDESAASLFFAQIVWEVMFADEEMWLTSQDSDLTEALYVRSSSLEAIMRGPTYGAGIVASMEAHIRGYRNERSDYYHRLTALLGGDAKDTREIEEIHKMAGPLVTAATALASATAVPRARAVFRRLVEERRKSPADRQRATAKMAMIREELMLELTDEVTKLIEPGADKLLNLLLLLEPLDPSRHGAQFLKRVSRCYLLGLDAECAVMCRSVLDAEFQAEVPNDDCRDFIGAPDRYSFSLDERIKTAVATGRIDAGTGQLAKEVKDIGNHVLHFKSDLKFDPLSVVKKTLAVVRVLHAE